MCRWMGSHFHDWIDSHGVAFSPSRKVSVQRAGPGLYQVGPGWFNP